MGPIESLSRTVYGSELQTAVAVHWKAHFAVVILVNGWLNVEMADLRRRFLTSSLSWSRR